MGAMQTEVINSHYALCETGHIVGLT